MKYSNKNKSEVALHAFAVRCWLCVVWLVHEKDLDEFESVFNEKGTVAR